MQVQGKLIALAIVLMSPLVRASDPFLLTAQTTSGTPERAAISGSSLPDLVGEFVKGSGPFTSFQNRDVSGSLKYGTLNNAIVVSKNSSNTSATLSIPSIAFKKVFTGTSAKDLDKQIEDFARKEGSHIYGEFIRSLNTRTDLGVTDGNPLATTALLANQAFTQFGLQPAPVPPGEGIPNPLDQVATSNIRFDIAGGYSRTGTGSGYYASGAFSLGFKFGDRVALVFDTPFIYRNVQGADVFNIGEEISLPILMIEPEGDRSFSWLVTPTVFGAAAGSVDLASGGTFLGGGLTSSLSFQINTFVFTVANQLDYFHGFPVSFSRYKFETNLDQTVTKNGLKISKFLSDWIYIDGGITHTDFLQRAAVHQYWTPTAGMGFRLGPYTGLRIGYAGDFGPGFIDHGGSVELYWNY